jgi:MbtH protein
MTNGTLQGMLDGLGRVGHSVISLTDADYEAVRNACESNISLWPSFIDVPAGWTIIHESDSRAACLDFINRNWTDMRPNSLIKRMKESGQA